MGISDWVNLATAIATAAAAVAAWRATLAAERSATGARDTAEAARAGVMSTNMSAIMDDYRSPEMRDALQHLSKIRESEADMAAWFSSGSHGEGWRSADAARRRILWFYRRGYELWKANLLREDFMAGFVTGTHGYELLLNAVVPMSRATTPGDDAATRFKWADELRSRWAPPKRAEAVE
jgi:hypothetical protein